MQYFDCISASGTVDSGSYSHKGEWKFLCASPLAGTVNQNNYKISTCGDAIFWLHFRKRNCRFWIVFTQRGMKIFMCISACGDHESELSLNLCLRGCDILIIFPQAELSVLGPWTMNRNKYKIGMQYFDCIYGSQIYASGTVCYGSHFHQVEMQNI